MTETPNVGATPTTPSAANEGTGSPADAAPVESNPTDSSAVSDRDSLAAQEAAQQKRRDELAQEAQEHQARVNTDDSQDVQPAEIEQTPAEVNDDGQETVQEVANSAADVEEASLRETQDGPGDLNAVGDNEVERNLEEE